MARVAPPKPESSVEKRRSLAEGEGALEALSPILLSMRRESKELPQSIWNATGFAALRRTLLREPLEALQERAVVELDLVPMVLMPKPQASTPRSEKQKSHEKKRDCIQELVYGETKRQKNVEGVWTEMASQFMMSDTDLMRTVPAPTSRATRSPLPTTRALSVAAPPSRGDV